MRASINPAQRRGALFAMAGLLCLIAGCEEPQPTSFAEFMEDEFARDGTLVRCNEDRDATLDDIECANARRAAAAIALREERARREALEIESERRIAELRAEVERERAAAALAHQRAEAAARAAYDAQWEGGDATPVGVDGQPLEAGQAIDANSRPEPPADSAPGSLDIASEPR
jgi:hypothetical protein